MNYMILPFKRYFDFSGRSRRMEYWMFTLLNMVVIAVLVFLTFALTGEARDDSITSADGSLSPFALATSGVGILIPVWFLIAVIPGIAVAVRRFHDRGMSGWWYLGFVVISFIPLLGFLGSIAFIVFMVLPGDPGSNRFGPNPKDPSNVEVFA